MSPTPKADEMRAALAKLRTDHAAAKRRLKQALIDGTDTSEPYDQIFEIDQRITEAESMVSAAVEETNRASSESIARVATGLVDGLRARSDAMIASLQAPPKPESQP